ncbi:molybdopterin biosynthesis protein MoeA [Microlunatus phosphovorus NM-1]|uniref:Molybdopterin molybdenumtransferase n=1 Tax=Microlunatus phosphovorus (strain ATCC 700054 / DSM 10555 / JCM 9379 / NBRC 101784 / NCIMB 13414 / VKM Ac-1990 / NM-1) TaxID=1032480 RepID=F5XE37_MICPN|nr:gephyrin-like molybdotransferase Glp [Microlunatus phosphovorus]BAK37585.1 molybdopterin biosynthesis protein MoeA [Microlunatus phosphovorus NM-1]
MPLFSRKKSEDAPARPAWEPLPPPPPVREDGLRSLEDHRDYLLSCVNELPAFGQQLLDAVDLAICEEVISPVSLPGFDNSAMDGYAVRAQDVASASVENPVLLPVVGEVPAGRPAPHRLSPGTAMKIMTGAPIPRGADAIVAYEGTDRGATDVEVYESSEVGRHIRRTGEDVAAGHRVFRPGDQLRPRAIGLLAAIGKDKVLVRPRPRVVVVATGSELVQPGQPLPSEFQIFDSNSYLLAAAARAAGAQVFRVGMVSDDPQEVRDLIIDQLVRADLVLTSGGVSQGDYDVVKAAMPELGATEFVQVAMQPGKPQGFGLIGHDRIPMIMLPGNPVSAFVSFEAFARPVIRKLMGVTPYVRPAAKARATHAMSSTTSRRRLARGIVTHDDDGNRLVSLAGGYGSHLIGDLARANALVVLPEDTDLVAAGDQVEVWLLDEGL